MMMRIRSFITLTLLGGLGVLLPAAVFALFVRWMFNLSTDLLSPITSVVVDAFGLGEHVLIGHLITLSFVIGTCFVVGLVVKTAVGRWIQQWFDDVLVNHVPGYKAVKDLVGQFLGGDQDKGSSLLKGEVAPVYLFGRHVPTTTTAIITSHHANGFVTIYIPTGPMPTNGISYHVPADCVEVLPNVTVEAAMRTIIACGAGASAVLAQSRFVKS